MLGGLTGLTALLLLGFVHGEEEAHLGLPHHLSNLSALRKLGLSHQDCMGRSAEALAASLTSLLPLAAVLTHLQLRQSGLECIPAAMGELTALEALNLWGCKLGSGSGAGGGGWVGAPISRLTRLTYLDLGCCGLEGVPQELAVLPRLAWLDFEVSRARRGGEGGSMACLSCANAPAPPP